MVTTAVFLSPGPQQGREPFGGHLFTCPLFLAWQAHRPDLKRSLCQGQSHVTCPLASRGGYGWVSGGNGGNMSVTTCDPGHASSWPASPAQSAQATGPLSMLTSNQVLVAADTDPLFPPAMATVRAECSRTPVPWILSHVDVGLGGCFQARSILNASAEKRGAPQLSESGWDTAHSISCWPVSTRAGQPGLRPASSWLSVQVPARSREPGSVQQDIPGRSASGVIRRTQTEEQCWRSYLTVNFIPCNGFSSTSTHRLHCSMLRWQGTKD